MRQPEPKSDRLTRHDVRDVIDPMRPRSPDGHFIRHTLLFSTMACLLPAIALAGPKNGQVVAGDSKITHNGNTTTIRQNTKRSVINWQQFSVGSGEQVKFVQPSRSSVSLNRVTGGNPSAIHGKLSANGQVYLVNPSGIYFGPGAHVDVSGLVASVLDISDQDFMRGNLVFESRADSAPGKVVNDGVIRAREAGYVVLMGDYAANNGVIQARMGQVVLASGRRVTMDVTGHNLINVAVDEGTVSELAGVENSGEIYADGGRVIMTAKVASDLISTAVNNSGLIRASSIVEQDGAIFLTGHGGQVVNSGTLDVAAVNGSNADGGGVLVYSNHDIDLKVASSIQARGDGSGRGGVVRVIAESRLDVEEGALVDVSGAPGNGGIVEVSGHGGLALRGQISLGSGGTLIVDPATFQITAGTSAPGGDTFGSVGKVFLETQLNGGNDIYLVANSLVTATAPMTIFASNPGGGDLNIINGDLNAGGSLGGPTNSSQCNAYGYCLGNSLGVGNFSITPSTNGNIQLGNVNFVLDGGLTVAGGTNTGNVQLGNIRAQGAVQITAGNNIDFQGGIDAAAGGLQATAGNDLLLNGDLGSSEGLINAPINLNAGRHVIINRDIIAGTGDINIAADTDGNMVGDVQINGATFERRRLNTDGNLTVSGQSFNVRGADFGESFSVSGDEVPVKVQANQVNVNLTGGMNLIAGRALMAASGSSESGGGSGTVDVSVSVVATGQVNVTANHLFVQGGEAAAVVFGGTYTTSGTIAVRANAELEAAGGDMTLNLANSLNVIGGTANATASGSSGDVFAAAEANAYVKATGNLNVSAGGLNVGGGSSVNAQASGSGFAIANAYAKIDVDGNLEADLGSGSFGIFSGSAFTSGGSASAGAVISATQLAVQAGNIFGSSGDLMADGITLQAQSSIFLSSTRSWLGNGSAPGVSGDPMILDVFEILGIERPNGGNPNLFFHADSYLDPGEIYLSEGNGYLWFESDFVSQVNISAPGAPLFVQYSPHTVTNEINIENVLPVSEMSEMVSLRPVRHETGVPHTGYEFAEHLDIPATTIAFGGAEQVGRITVGLEGNINVAARNIFLLTTPDDVDSPSNIITSGIIATSSILALKPEEPGGGGEREPGDFVTPRLENFSVSVEEEDLYEKRREERETLSTTEDDHGMCTAL